MRGVCVSITEIIRKLVSGYLGAQRAELGALRAELGAIKWVLGLVAALNIAILVRLLLA